MEKLPILRDHSQAWRIIDLQNYTKLKDHLFSKLYKTNNQCSGFTQDSHDSVRERLCCEGEGGHQGLHCQLIIINNILAKDLKPPPRDRQGSNAILPMAPNHFEFIFLSIPKILKSITTLQVKGKGLMRTYFVLGRKISRGRYGKGGSGANNTSLAEVCLTFLLLCLLFVVFVVWKGGKWG